jgi:hypothetical protein
MQGITFLPWPELHDRLITEVFNQPVQNLAAQALTRHFAPTEEDGRLNLVALRKETQNMVLLGVVVVVVYVDAELHFLDHDLMLMLLGFALTLFLLVQVLPVIHDPANGRLRGGRNFNQVQGLFAGYFERLEGWHDSQLIPFIINHADFADTDALVGANKTFIDTILQTNFCTAKYSMRFRQDSDRNPCPRLLFNGTAAATLSSENFLRTYVNMLRPRRKTAACRRPLRRLKNNLAHQFQSSDPRDTQ